MNHAFLTFEQPRQYKLWSCQKMCDALHYLYDNIFIRFGSKLYRQTVGIQWVLIVLFLLQICFCFVMRKTSCCFCQTIIKLILLTEAFNSTFRYLDDFLNIDNPYFEQMVCQIYPIEFQLNKANSTDTEAPFLDLDLSITNGIVPSKIDDKRDDFNFEVVNFPFLDEDVPCSSSWCV